MRRALLAAVVLALAPSALATELPPEGRCPGASVAGAATSEVDATRAPLRSGDVIAHDALARVRDLLPPELWRHRDVFFFDGMRFTVSACHRRYAASESFEQATRANAGTAQLDARANLITHAAGLPFPFTAIDASAPDAGAHWAWNLERRYRGAGPRGSFRLLDLPDARALASRTTAQLFTGEFFFAQTAHRADLVDLREPARNNNWVAGGVFRAPGDARGLAWRQYRLREVAADARRSDDVFVYLPDLRKTRRAASVRGDGMFVPRYRAAGQGNARVIPYGQGARMGAIEAGHAGALAATEDIARGFSAFALRPNAWTWRLLAEREVLAPLNARAEGWPLAERNYGPSGLSLADDAWDVRWAVVIEGRARDASVPLPRVIYWIDEQTAQPLYVMRSDASGTLREVGVLAHRYSGDIARYPAFPGGEDANVFDPVAEAFLALPSGGWRRESHDVRSTPLPHDELRALLSTDALSRGR
jgi:hypothetical protein